MKPGSGSAKGAEFERHVCKLLSKWVTAGEKSDVFWRTSLSGGRATVARARGEHLRQAGDITAVAPEGHLLTERLYFELKFYKNLELVNFFIKNKGTLSLFWAKTVEEAASYERTPVLVAKQDRCPALLLTSPGALDHCLSEQLVCRTTVFTPSSACLVYHLDDVLSVPYKRSISRKRV